MEYKNENGPAGCLGSRTDIVSKTNVTDCPEADQRVINKFTDVRKNDLTPSCWRMTRKMKSVVKQQAPSAGEEIEH